MYVSVMGELADVVAVNLQFLPAYCIPWPRIRSARLWGLRAARSQRVKELVLPFGGMRREAWSRPSIFLFQIVPLPLSAGVLSMHLLSYLYACVLGSEIDGAMMGRVCDAKDVSDIVWRPESVKVSEGRRAPDLMAQHTPR
jgi:hypothetical protein